MKNLPISPTTMTRAATSSASATSPESGVASGESAFSAVLSKKMPSNSERAGKPANATAHAGEKVPVGTPTLPGNPVPKEPDPIAVGLLLHPGESMGVTQQGTPSKPAKISTEAIQGALPPGVLTHNPYQASNLMQGSVLQSEANSADGNVVLDPPVSNAVSAEGPASSGGNITPAPSGLEGKFAQDLRSVLEQAKMPENDATSQVPAAVHEDKNEQNASISPPLYGSTAAATLPASTSLPSASTLTSTVGTDRWHEELGQKITWLTTQSDHSAELHLNPPDLGPLKVVLHVSGDQATALFTSPHAAVREAVTEGLSRLRDMLADNGIMLGNASVSDQGSSAGQGGNSGWGQHPGASSSQDGAGVSSVRAGGPTAGILVTQGLVDTFA